MGVVRAMLGSNVLLGVLGVALVWVGWGYASGWLAFPMIVLGLACWGTAFVRWRRR
jgi:hypothetical protein